ncbi:MAG TPA: amidohydrolase family protein [Myxococcota bacterium]|nr:amidohydrolase family protein [Myxococcota bacterium]
MLWFLIACQSEPEWGVEYGEERLPVVDMHLHPGEWELIPPATQAFLTSRFPFPFSLNPEGLAASVLTGEGILGELDKGGIEAGMLFAVYAPRTVGIASNEYVGEQLQVDPQRLYGLASLRVDQWDSDEEAELAGLEDAVDSYGFVGIKLAHAHQHFRMDDPRYYSIYALAGQRGLPIYLHTGTSPFPGTAQEPAYTDPAYLEEAIALYPDTVFILGHLGFDFINKKPGALDHCIALATQYPNVWLEPSALGSRSSDPDGAVLAAAMRAIREAGLVDRTIYGSDGPQSPGFAAGYLERTVAAMQSAGYSNEEARKVLSENFYALFGKHP